MSRKFRIMLSVVVLLAVILSGCGGNTPDTSQQPSYQTPSVSPYPQTVKPLPSGESSPEQSPEPSPEAPSQQPSEQKPAILTLQDPWVFLGGSLLDENQTTATEIMQLTFNLKPEEDVLALQYVTLLQNGAYNLEKVEIVETSNETVHAFACYFKYVGDGELRDLGLNRNACNLFIGIRRDEGEKTTFVLTYPAGVRFADYGARADRTAIPAEPSSEPVIQPTTEPAPLPTPSTQPSPAPSTSPSPTPAPQGPSVIPDFLAQKFAGDFRAGTSAYDHAVCFLASGDQHFEVAEAYVQLLLDMGYRITKTDEKVKRTYSRYQWNLYHDGVDSSTIEDDTHVRVKILSRANDGNPKTEISIGYGDGIIYGGDEQYQGGGGGSGGGGGWDPYVPDHSKLPCLTCGGDGSCTTCGGDGYTGFGDAKAGCRSCHGNGKCRVCGGSGTR